MEYLCALDFAMLEAVDLFNILDIGPNSGPQVCRLPQILMLRKFECRSYRLSSPRYSFPLLQGFLASPDCFAVPDVV